MSVSSIQGQINFPADHRASESEIQSFRERVGAIQDNIKPYTTSPISQADLKSPLLQKKAIEVFKSIVDVLVPLTARTHVSPLKSLLKFASNEIATLNRLYSYKYLLDDGTAFGTHPSFTVSVDSPLLPGMASVKAKIEGIKAKLNELSLLKDEDFQSAPIQGRVVELLNNMIDIEIPLFASTILPESLDTRDGLRERVSDLMFCLLNPEKADAVKREAESEAFWAKHEADMAKINAEHEADMAKLDAEHKAFMAEHEAEMAKDKARHEAFMAEHEASRANIAKRDAEHEAFMAEHEATMAKLRLGQEDTSTGVDSGSLASASSTKGAESVGANVGSASSST